MKPLCIGITCYPTFGGSGIVATEVGRCMARRGHQVHFICTDLPVRLDPDETNIVLHRVEAKDYPVFPNIPYSLALTSAMVDVARRVGLDVLHAHYAVPHAVSAWMAREVLGESGPRVVTTLHGTDTTLVGADPSYLPITRHAILHSDAVTVPSEFLAQAATHNFHLADTGVDIQVIPNFVDTTAYRPHPGGPRELLNALFGGSLGDVPVLVHTSNFRRVKRPDRVARIFARVSQHLDCRLLLMGSGPEQAPTVEWLLGQGLLGKVRCVPRPADLPGLLREANVFLLPSETESFGLAALEALSSGVPAVTSNVGGLPEVVQDGLTGHLRDPDDIEAMAGAVLALLTDSVAQARQGRAAREDVLARFQREPVADRYEALYRWVSGRASRSAG